MSDPKKARERERALREEVLIWNKINNKKKEGGVEHMHTRARTNERERSVFERERESSRREISYTQ